jgi:hypothetical protein
MASINPGDFASLQLSQMEIDMLSDSYQAVSSVSGGWEYLARPEIPNEGSFMFGREDETLLAINAAMKYDGHSGFSYAWTMRTMELIAKKGWDAYSEKFSRTLTNGS